MLALLQVAPVQALTCIIHGPNKTDNASVILLDYRNEATFRGLWLDGLHEFKFTIGTGEEAQPLDWTKSDQQILLIGNDPPDGTFDISQPSLKGINFSSHFSATAWLAAWKIKYSPTDDERKQGAVEAMTKIAVIDPREAKFNSGATRALQTIFGANVGSVSNSPLSLVPSATVLNDPSLMAICKWLHDSKSDTRTVGKDAPHLRALLKSTIWNELISTSEKHHAISNVLGPLILSGRPESNPPVLNHETLLRRLLSACGLITWNDADNPPGNIIQGASQSPVQTQSDGGAVTQSDPAPVSATGEATGEESSVHPEYPPEPIEEGEGLNILLLDDQAEQGWAGWIKECLPKAKAGMEVLTDPTKRIRALIRILLKSKNAAKDARFRLTLPNLGEVKNPVLLLDLRLFSGNSEAELKFYKELLPLVNHFTDKADLAWPGFSSKDKRKDKPFRDAKAAILRGKLKADSPAHHEVLTWLPRVIALADMSLPIILFSSTGRRDLVEPFKAYGNIITSFEKPRLSDLAFSVGDAGGIRSATVASLREAMRAAREWLRLREVVKRGIESATRRQNPSMAGTRATHFEIYFDESGSSRADGFRVAALIVGYRDSKHALRVAEEMQGHGITWFGDADKRCYEKSLARASGDLERLGQLFAPALKELWMLPLVLWSNPEDQQVSSDSFNADTLIQSLIGEILELALFLILPTKADCTYVIFGAQRRIVIPATEFEVEVHPPLKKMSRSVPAGELGGLSITLPTGVLVAVQEFKEKYGIGDDSISFSIGTIDWGAKVSGRAMFVSVATPQDYGGILARTFQTRPWVDPWKQLSANVTVRFSSLNHPERASLENGDRPVHILADILPGDATWDARGATLNVFPTMLPHRGVTEPILVAEGGELSRLLAIGRTVDGGNYALALANAAGLSDEFLNHAADLYHAAFAAIAAQLPSIKGNDLVGAVHYLSAHPAAKDAPLPFSRVDLRHQHWTRYPPPDPSSLAAVESYAQGKILVHLGISASRIERTVAAWVQSGAVREKYPGLSIASVEWMQDKPTDSLFAIVSYSGGAKTPPFRLFTWEIPNSLRVDRATNDLKLKISMGAVPLGRLKVNAAGQVEWVEASPATMVDVGWTEKQISAVANNEIKCLTAFPLRDAEMIIDEIAPNSTPRWIKTHDGYFHLFLDDAGVADACRALDRGVRTFPCGPDDFSPDGVFLHEKPSWPSVPRPQTIRTSALDHSARSIAGTSQVVPDSPQTPPKSAIVPDSGRPKASHPVSSLQTANVEVKAIATDKAWLGPVPINVKSSPLIQAAQRCLTGWTPQETKDWVGGNDKGWWMPLHRGGENADSLPSELVLLGHSFSITTKNPVS